MTKKLTKKMVAAEDRKELRIAIENVLMTHQIPALTAHEIYKILCKQIIVDGTFITPGQVAGQLMILNKQNVVRKRLCPTASLTLVYVPGRVVRQYSAGMVPVAEAKNHWFMYSRRNAYFELKKARRQAFKEKHFSGKRA